MKTLNNLNFMLFFIISVFTTSLKSQNYSCQIAAITETAEYQKQKKLGEMVFSSLKENVPRGNENHFIKDIFIENSLLSAKTLETAQLDNWTKLDLNNDGSVLLELPFNFNFFDLKTQEIWINANGNLSLNQSVGHYTPEYFPIYIPMIAPFWADLEANKQNRDAGVYFLEDSNVVRILYKDMSLYNEDPKNTLSFEVAIYDDSKSNEVNLTFTYYHLSPRLIGSLIKNQVAGKPLFITGINYGDADNHILIQLFENLVYTFNLSSAEVFAILSQEYYAFDLNPEDELLVPAFMN